MLTQKAGWKSNIHLMHRLKGSNSPAPWDNQNCMCMCCMAMAQVAAMAQEKAQAGMEVMDHWNNIQKRMRNSGKLPLQDTQKTTNTSRMEGLVLVVLAQAAAELVFQKYSPQLRSQLASKLHTCNPRDTIECILPRPIQSPTSFGFSNMGFDLHRNLLC